MNLQRAPMEDDDPTISYMLQVNVLKFNKKCPIGLLHFAIKFNLVV